MGTPGELFVLVFFTLEFMTDNSQINTAFIGIARRAETVQTETLVSTFVDVGPLLAVLSANNHQIVYGRRGTGKTHALIYMLEKRRESGDVGAFIDLRTIGSSGGLYADASISLAERGTRLLLDVLSEFHKIILDLCIQEQLDLSAFSPVLDELASASSQVQVVGEVTREFKGRAE